MSKKVKLCLALFLALAVLAQYSFSPQAMVAYGLDNTDQTVQTEEAVGDDEQSADTQEATEPSTEPAAEATEATEAAQPAEADKPTAEDKQDVSYPAKDFSETVDGLKVNISAPEGALPEGTTVKVEPVKASEIKDAVDELIDDGKIVKAVDITFYNKKGKEIEPDKKVSVTFASKEFKKLDNAQVVHINDEGEAEAVKGSSVDGNKATFKANDFSIYVVVDSSGTTQEELITYQFQNADGSEFKFNDEAGNKVSTQIIKDGERLKPVDMPEIPDGETFKGWFVYEGGAYTSEVTFDEPITVTETKTVTIRPYFGDVVYVSFYENSAGTNILNRIQVVKGASYTITQTAAPPTSTLAFKGWAETAGVDNDDRDVITSTTVTLNADKDYFPVFKSAYWITFHSGPSGSGATYYAPVSIWAGDTAASAKPSPDPKWTGHEFEGWAETEDPDPMTSTSFTPFNFNSEPTKNIDLYAQWTAGNVNYNIVYWKQNVSDSKSATDEQKTYAFAKQENKTARAGSTVTPAAAGDPDVGFVLNTSKSDLSVVVKADGTSVINVYYDRQTITMKFYKNGNSTSSPGYNNDYYNTDTGDDRVTVFKGLYVQTLAQNNYTWPAGTWSYFATGNSAIGLSYLGQFVLDLDVRDTTKQEIRLYYTGNSNTSTIEFYLQNANGSYGNTANDSGTVGRGGTFTFTEKYDGYEVVQYRRYTVDGNNNRTWVENNWQSAANGSRVDLYYVSWNGRYTYYNLAIRYKLKAFNFKYLDSVDGSPLAGIDTKSVLYTAPLNTCEPASTYTPTSKYAGKSWDGRWYLDQACQTIALFNNDTSRNGELGNYTSINTTSKTVTYGTGDEAKTYNYTVLGTMPNADMQVYAGWEDIWYWIKIDPNGGQLSATESTWFWETYGELVQEYSDITRNFVEDAAGTYYYHYDEFNQSNPDGTQPSTRKAYYTTVASEATSTTKYKAVSEDRSYALIGWYDVTNGEDNKKPYNFSTEVTGNLILKAEWRRIGEYKVVYEHESAVDDKGNPVNVAITDWPTDQHSYADKSSSAMMHSPQAPDGYSFEGWYYNNKIYKPGDVYQILADLADDNKNVHVYPVLVKAESLPVEVTQLTFNGNGGKNGNDETVTLSDQQNNTQITLSDQGFTRDGYTLTGWNTKADGSGDTYVKGTKIGFDIVNKNQNILYAMWQKNNYTVTVSKEVVGTDKSNTFTFSYTVDGVQQSNFTLAGEETQIETEGSTVTVPQSKDLSVPFGSKLVIKEVNTGYTTTVNDADYDAENGYKYTVTSADNQELVFTNTINQKDVTLTKTFTGLEESDVEKLTDFEITNNYNSAKFTLTDEAKQEGEGITYSWTIIDVPFGTKVDFTETGYDALTDKYWSGTAGTDNVASVTVGEGDATATITNAYSEKKVINVEANSTEAVYDGQPHTATGFKTLEFTFDGNTYTVSGLTTSNPSSTDATTTDLANTISGTAVVKNAAGEDVTGQFTVNTTNGTLKVTKRTVTLVSESGSKPYDGTPLTKPTVTGWEQSGDTGFVTGEVSDVKATGSVTTVAEGEVTNTITYEEGDAFKADNYQITKTEGKLKITKVNITVTIKGNTAKEEYDGTEKSVSGYEISIPGNSDLTKADISGPEQNDAVAEGIDAGDYDMGLKAADFENSNENYNVTFAVTDGTLTIAPCEITITTGSASKPYDGTPLTYDQYAVSGLPAADEGKLKVTVTGSQTEVGSSPNSFTYEFVEPQLQPTASGEVSSFATVKASALKDNYTVKEKPGTLTVTAAANTDTDNGDNGEESSSETKTGDSTNLLGLLAMMTAAMAGLFALLVVRRKEEEDK